MKKVLIISYYWPPSGGAGVQRWLKFTKFLPDFGWEPIILTVRPEDASYPVLDATLEDEVQEGIRVFKTPSREIYKIYQKISGAENIPSAGFANEDNNSFKQKAARFIRGNFFIPDPRKGWNKYAISAALKILAEEKDIHCIVTTGPPQSTQLIGLKLRRKLSIPWIADFRDPWTDIYYYDQLYATFPAHKLNLAFEKRVIKKADRIITAVGPSFKKKVTERYGIDEEKVNIVLNGFDEDDFINPRNQKEVNLPLTYVGTLSDQYPIDNLVDALHSIIGDHPHIKLRFVGSVSANARKVLSRIPENNIEYISQVSHLEAIEYMKRSNALLLIIPDHSSGEGILPGKLFEYLAARIPIVGIGPANADSADILTRTGHGKMFDYRNRQGLEEMLKQCLVDSSFPRDGLDSPSSRQYSRKNQTERLAGIFNEVKLFE